MAIFGADLLYDPRTGRGLGGVTVSVRHPTTGAPVAVSTPVVTNAKGYFSRFETVGVDASLEHVTLTVEDAVQDAVAVGSMLSVIDPGIEARVAALESDSGTSEAVVAAAEDAAAAYLATNPGVVDAAALAAQDAIDAQGGIQDPVIAAALSGTTQTADLLRAALTAPQVDYVSTLARLSTYDRMTLKKVNSLGDLLVTCHAGTSGAKVTYAITPPIYYQTVGAVSATFLQAAPTLITVKKLWPEDITTTGTFTAPGAAYSHTTQVGATWSTSITTTQPNTAVTVRTITESRGGMWHVTVPGTSITDVPVSCYSASAGNRSTVVGTIATPGTYTITGTFIGDDPANAPSSSPSRGIVMTQTDGTDDLVSYQAVVAGATTTVELAPASNKDFAVRLRPVGSTGNYEYVPYHGTASEVFASPTRYFDGPTPLDVAGMAAGAEVEVGSFEIVQNIYGRNSTAPNPSQNLAEFWTTQRIAPDGTYSVSGRWKALTNLDMNAGSYHLMHPTTMPTFNKVVSSLTGSYAVAPAMAPVNLFVTEADYADSWVSLSSVNKDVAAAVRYDNRRETLRAGQSSKAAPAARTYIELRSSGNMTKLYPMLFTTGTVVPAGSVHRFGGAYWFGWVPGVHDALSLT